MAILQTEKAKLQTEVQESKKEQDDLLMLLADQDLKIQNLKQRLKELGETVDKPSILCFSKCFGTHFSFISSPQQEELKLNKMNLWKYIKIFVRNESFGHTKKTKQF